MTKSFQIPKALIWQAYKIVRANKGGAGIDGESLETFEKDLSRNLYKIWNRMCSGSYFPPPIRRVAIPKRKGGERILGIPTVADRVAQTAIKLVMEPLLEPFFHPDSFGYRPNRSALDAVALVRRRSWKFDWVVEFDVRRLFDEISHELLWKAIRHHIKTPWVLLYLERWLTAPMEQEDGTLKARDRGTPQGGVVSPVLSNLFLHYTFDLWMTRELPEARFCRYADDGVIHCRTREEAELVLKRL
ncbi:MAG: group II intron reverse transcriptase/maturase, partial [Myxococcota bacterium]